FMTYRLRITPRAQRHIDDFSAYLEEYNEEFAVEHMDGLRRVLIANLAESPLTWSYFPFTSAPYRGYLFRVGHRTQYWIVYTVDEDSRTIDTLHSWNARRDPATLDL